MAHFAQSPSFILHQVTCQFATGNILFGPLNLSLETSLCALVGRNGSGKTRLLRMLAGLDEPASGHIVDSFMRRVIETSMRRTTAINAL